jgi:hypothetical protein
LQRFHILERGVDIVRRREKVLLIFFPKGIRYTDLSPTAQKPLWGLSHEIIGDCSFCGETVIFKPIEGNIIGYSGKCDICKNISFLCPQKQKTRNRGRRK